jgi:copper chaperone NosL
VTPRPALALAAALALSACSKENAGGPPKIRYGEDVCADCGMIISDERFAAAVTPPGAAALLYDDIGDLLKARSESAAPASAPAWVHDAESKQWLPAEKAWYVRDEKVMTPMGSGIAAYATEAAAKARGTPLTWAQLTAK